MHNDKKVLEYIQNEIDEIYGKGEWTLIEYSGSKQPIKLEHKCGAKKTISRYTNFKRGFARCVNRCEKENK